MAENPKGGQHWLNPRRIRVYALILLATYAASLIFFFAFGDGATMSAGAVGSDYSVFRAASVLILEGRPAAPYHMATLLDTMRSMLAELEFSVMWNYPPFFHFAIFWLALLPYVPAYMMWCALTFLPLALLMWRLAPRSETLWLLAAFPGTFTNLAYGQNGFLSAAFLGGGLCLVARRPVVAGILFGLLTFKPHLGILIPLGLICARQWTAFASAAATTAIVSAASLAVFGMEPWIAFLDNLAGAVGSMSEGLFPLQKMPTLYATLVLLDVDKTVAIVGHGILAALIVPPVAWVWWKRGPTPAGAALLVTATLFLSPYLYEYDLMVLAVPIGLLAWQGHRDGWLPWEREVLVLAWLTPFVVRISGTNLGVQVGTACLLALYVIALRRALEPGGDGGEGRHRPAQVGETGPNV